MPKLKPKKNAPSLAPVVLEEAWSRLVSENYIDNTLLRREIALSWKRCLTRKIDPVKTASCGIVKDFLEQDAQAKRLFTVSSPHIRQLYEAVKGEGYIAFLADANGIIINILGDRKTLSHAESQSLIPGASCAEDTIGTSSPGLCLIQKQPVQIVSLEHYCRNYHDWSCSSAPILDSRGDLLGILDLSNIDQKPHPRLLLDLVRMTAAAIGSDWELRVLQEDVREKYYYFNTALDSIPEPFIFLDGHNNISHINANARKLLGESAKTSLGQNIQVLLPEHRKITRALADGQRWTDIRVDTAQGPAALSVNINPIKNKYLKQIGAICALKLRDRHPEYRNLARYTFEDFISVNDKVQLVLQQARQVAAGDGNVLIRGESGTGKEILAQAIHNASPRRSQPFVAVNCAALPLELIQSELFGYEEGTFTGAKKGGKVGKFELAQGGTLFLDEIGDMPLPAQANLLRALQEKCVTRLGGDAPIALDVRVIAATNKDLHQDIARAQFRADLFYRLAAVSLHVPPLRERKDDIWPIVFHIIKKHYAHQIDTSALHFSHQVRAILETHDWPGNVRELENVVLFFLNKIENNAITIHDLPAELRPEGEMPDVFDLKVVEQCTIQSILARFGNNISASAKALGISRATLYRKMRDYRQTAG